MRLTSSRLMNANELRLFKSIEYHIKRYSIDSLRVFTQVALNQLVSNEVAEMCYNSFDNYDVEQFYLRSSVDFVLYDTYFNIPLVVFELQGRSHLRDSQRLRDGIKAKLLSAGDITLFQIWGTQNYKYDLDKFMKKYKGAMYAE